MSEIGSSVHPIAGTSNADGARSTNGHTLINAFEMCPHLWDLLEDAAASGCIDLTEWAGRIGACTQCKKDLVSLAKKLSTGATGTASFIVNQAISMMEKKLQ